MAKPTKIADYYTLSGQKWHVNTSADTEKALELGSNLGLMGEEFEEIYMKRTGRSLTALWKYLLHEIMHVIIVNGGLNHTILRKRDELECVVEVFSTGMLDFLISNNIIDVEERHAPKKRRRRAKKSQAAAKK